MQKNMPVAKENNQLKQDVLNCIQKLNQKDLSIENVVEYIDYVRKIRYTEKGNNKCLTRNYKIWYGIVQKFLFQAIHRYVIVNQVLS